MTELFERVLHHIEGNETEIQNWETRTGTERYSVTKMGPDRWIERAALGRMMAIDVLAVILFSVRDSFDLENECRIVESWALELRNAANGGEIEVRDPITLLELGALPDGWEWLISTSDVDRFLAVRGMTWKCSEQVNYLLQQCREAGTQYRDPKTGHLLKHYWRTGCEPKQAVTAHPAHTRPQAMTVEVASVESDSTMPSPAPLVNVPARLPTIKKDGVVLKRAAAIAKYSATWRTIKTDFKHASENDLSEAAKATKHGYWYENALLAWADQRGKRIEPVQLHTAVNSVFNLPGKKHTLKG